MPRFGIKRYEQILSQMLAKVVTRTELSDISDTSVVKHILAAAARQDDEIYYQMTLLLDMFSIDKAAGEDLDERAKDIQPALISRNPAAKASGNLVFSRETVSGTVVIPAGTKGKTASGQIFTTTAAGSITPTSPAILPGHGVGQDSGLISALADVAGIDGNVVMGTIIKFAQKPIGVDAVYNPDPFLWGTDRESDDSFRERLKRYIATLARSTPSSLQNAVLGAQDPVTGSIVLFASVVEDPANRGYVTVYVDDGTGSAEAYEAITGEILTEALSGPPPGAAVGGEEVLFTTRKPIKGDTLFTIASTIRGILTIGSDFFLNRASGQINFTPGLTAGEILTVDYTAYTGLIAFVQKIVDGDLLDPINFPGYRAAGILVYVRTPQVLTQSVTATVVVKDGYDHSEVRANVKNSIMEYINGLGISGDVLVAEIVRKAMTVAGVYNFYLISPTGDIYLLDDQIARITEGNIIIN
jgi:uncharacterized phage protein gp47/JayE